MGLLLVEPAIAENSVETNNLDPSTLVTTPAKIKELIKAKIDEVAPGNLPDYKFNKQLSSAYITNLDGNKVLEDGFSYIAKAGDYLFLAKNTPDTDVKVFSIPENKIVEEKKAEVAPVAENTEVVIPSLDTTKVEESAPTDLSNVFGDTSTVDENANNLSFEEITSETPTNEVGGETPMANTMSEADFDAALASLDNDKQDMITAMQDGKSFIDQQANETSYDEYDPLADYQGFHEDKLEYDTESNNEYAMDDNLDIVQDTTAKEFVQAFEDLRKENSNKDRELGEARGIIEKLKLSIEKKDAENERLKQGKELATSAIRDLRETVAKQAAEIERVKNAADIYKGKADGFKYELAEKDREIARLKSQAEGIDDIRSALERYKAGKEYNDSYSDAEVYMKY